MSNLQKKEPESNEIIPNEDPKRNDTKPGNIFKDGIPFKGAPINGEYEIRSKSNVFFVFYNEGKKNGKTRIYDTEKNLQKTVTYKNDVMEGEIEVFHENGCLIQKMMYKNGKKEGPFVSYNNNGVKLFEAHYKNDLLEGPFIAYDSFGDISTTCTYVKGKKEGASVTYFAKSQGGGICQVDEYKDDLLENTQKLFHPTGELLQTTPYSKGRALTYPVSYARSGEPMAANRNG
jgi:antitoxin component YwqK of YwqJK toxin-antitoxin module